ncbi:MAG TPA: methyltransferase domain-containing protein [Jatrophihabitans sp.]|nr:methyltransferase domain-containing protein [Jatrophihabitans sp.]
MAGLSQKLTWSQQRTSAFERYAESATLLKLQLGAGTHALPGWFNTDLQPAPPHVHYLDSTAKFPFEDASLDYVFSEHHIEHIPWDRAQFMLAECHRVLRPGGGLRIATPSLEVLVGLLTPAPDQAQQRYIDFISETFLQSSMPAGAVGVVNNAFSSWGHQFLYDRPTLLRGLTDAGFARAHFTDPGASRDPELRGIEGHGDFLGNDEMNRFETMVVEAIRPAA